MPYYGVRAGRTVGVFDNWDDCAESVLNYSNHDYRKFPTYDQANAFVCGYELSDDEEQGAVGGVSRAAYLADSGFYGHDETEDYYYVDWLGEVYVDGCCIGNGTPEARAGIGIYWGDDSPFNISARLTGPQTNQRAEIEAARKAIIQSKQQGFDHLNLYTDSKYFKQCMEEFIIKWEQNGWINSKGLPVVHAQEYQALQEEMDCAMVIDIIHINSHSGIFGNDEADRLAKLGANKPLPSNSYHKKGKYVATPMGPRRNRRMVVPHGTMPWEVDLYGY